MAGSDPRWDPLGFLAVCQDAGQQEADNEDRPADAGRFPTCWPVSAASPSHPLPRSAAAQRGVGSELALASDMRFASREKAILLQ
jgi:hypothetical protein